MRRRGVESSDGNRKIDVTAPGASPVKVREKKVAQERVVHQSLAGGTRQRVRRERAARKPVRELKRHASHGTPTCKTLLAKQVLPMLLRPRRPRPARRDAKWTRNREPAV